jgi:ribonuclease D
LGGGLDTVNDYKLA